MTDVGTEQLYDRDTARAFYDARYGSGYMDAWPGWKCRRVFAQIRELGLPSRGTALDFGCGNGVFSEILRQALPGWRVCGTDPSPTAIKHARRRVPGCEFFSLGEARDWRGRFDFVFSHHVLEHVPDLEDAISEAAAFLRSQGAMFHVLPCGNEGSLEHRICSLRRDGIDASLGGRFFFEDVAHLRRLRTDDLVALAEAHGFSLATERYANQYHGARSSIAGRDPASVQQLLELDQAEDPVARKALGQLVRPLRWDARAAAFSKRYAYWRGVPVKRVKHWIALAVGFPVGLACRAWLARLERLANAEWRSSSTARNGSEMSLSFTRKTARD